MRRLSVVELSRATAELTLRSQADERWATKMDVAAHVLNRMRELGRPNYVRIA